MSGTNSKQLWEFADASLRPYEAARLFVERYFPEPREIAELVGSWEEGGYTGTFQLVDGTHTYILKCISRGRIAPIWEVWRQDP